MARNSGFRVIDEAAHERGLRHVEVELGRHRLPVIDEAAHERGLRLSISLRLPTPGTSVIDEAAHERGLRLLHYEACRLTGDASSMKPRMNAD